MPKIKKLDPQEIIKIAAGEVIERPANVIKELLENSVDAQATQISLFVEDAGKKLIQIVDDGTGMSKEDAMLSIEHHATSKLNSVHDLDKILTFGFRGEALSSITSISKVRLTTKEAADLTATELEISGGEILGIKMVSANTGTSICIEDIFFNVPVRKKFLKSKETEFRAILHLFHAFCFSNLSISFKLYSDKKLIYNCPAAKNLAERLEQIYDQELTNNLILIEDNDNNNKLQLTGIVSKPSYNRYDRNQIFIFVNNRWVKNYKLTQALTRSYQGALQPDKFPAGFLFLTIDPKEIDINIHPKKEEVQFLHPRIAEQFITKAIKNSLDTSVKQSLHQQTPLPNEPVARTFSAEAKFPTIPFYTETSQTTFDKSEPKIKLISLEDIVDPQPEQTNHVAFSSVLDNYFGHPKQEPLVDEELIHQQWQEKPSMDHVHSTFKISTPLIHDQIKENISTTLEIFKPTENLKCKIVGQMFDTYIIIENDNEVVFVDQHAAHERVIYEKIKHSYQIPEPIGLLINQIMTISAKDLITLEPHLSLLQDQGIVAEPFGKDKLIIKALPSYLRNKSIEDIIQQTVALIEHNADTKELKIQIQDDLQKQISCKAAVKGGDKLTIESMHNIISSLYKTDNKLTCPHGRPTIWSINKSEIEKKFKRDYKGKVYSSIFDND